MAMSVEDRAAVGRVVDVLDAEVRARKAAPVSWLFIEIADQLRQGLEDDADALAEVSAVSAA